MSKRRRKQEPKDSGHYIVPVWNSDFAMKDLAKALLLLAIDLDKKDKAVHTNRNIQTGSDGGGGGHE